MARIIFPPRPKGKTTPQELAYYESTGQWLVQRKFRGMRNLIHVKDGKLNIYTRHGTEHLRYKLPAFLRDELMGNLKFNPNYEYWVDSELMDPRIENVVILFDILQEKDYLLGEQQLARLDRLSQLCGQPTKANDMALQVSEHVWLAQFWTENFLARFKEALSHDYLEGLVLRKKDSVLDKRSFTEYNCDWQIRCRKPDPNYTY